MDLNFLKINCLYLFCTKTSEIMGKVGSGLSFLWLPFQWGDRGNIYLGDLKYVLFKEVGVKSVETVRIFSHWKCSFHFLKMTFHSWLLMSSRSTGRSLEGVKFPSCETDILRMQTLFLAEIMLDFTSLTLSN